MASNSAKQNSDLVSLTATLKKAQPKLEKRLHGLKHAYHNYQHTEEVAGNIADLIEHLSDAHLLSDREKLLLIESAWRHDDDHSGNLYRQEVYRSNLSNEEHAVVLLKDDLEDKIPRKDMDFLAENILATSFGQLDVSRLPVDKHHYYRPYKPSSPAQKLLALADIGSFKKGWEHWISESFRLTRETKSTSPWELDEWLRRRDVFARVHLTHVLHDCYDYLNAEYFRHLEQRLGSISGNINMLRDPGNLERKKYQAMLNQIRDK